MDSATWVPPLPTSLVQPDALKSRGMIGLAAEIVDGIVFVALPVMLYPRRRGSRNHRGPPWRDWT